MEKEIFVISDNIISPLGFNTEANFNKLLAGTVSLKVHNNSKLSNQSFCASIIENVSLDDIFITQNHQVKLNVQRSYTKLEKMIILSINDTLSSVKKNIINNDTLFVLSSTKGNIELLNPEVGKFFDKERIHLYKTAEIINQYLGLKNKPIVVSLACISGLSAILTAVSLIREKKFKNIIISGADLVGKFVLSGFLSFQALSNLPCKPYDKDRNGLNLGEGCGTIIISSDSSLVNDKEVVVIKGGAISNDANHISGPSRTGEGLYIAINKILSRHKNSNIDYVSAHGTATEYNDAMEAKAFEKAGLENIPTNSLKGYYGHTLGAAGLIESIIGIQCLKKNILLKSMGYEKHGVEENLNIIKVNENKQIKNLLKTASGFGGCNAAILFSKL